MSKNRKKNRSDRGSRSPMPQQPYQSARILSGREINILREVEYITRRAAEHDARCVTLGELVFFSTQTGDAWMLDVDDEFALCLARDGVSQPVRIIKSDSTTAIEWDRNFAIDGESFTTMVKKTGRVENVYGYPTEAILAAVKTAKEVRG